jgi:NitT/TauT family transport system substrate-binding protein
VVGAILKGADIKIISANTTSPADMSWVARLDSNLTTLKDLKGKKLAYTNPGSTTQSLAIMMLDTLNMSKDVELVKTGGLGEGVVALDNHIVDAAPVYEPLLSEKRSKYRVLASGGDVLPPLTTNVGFTSKKAAETRGDFIRGVVAGRRKAVEFMHSNPDEAAAIVARAYRLETSVVRQAFENIFAIEKRSGNPYYGLGDIKPVGLKNGVKAMELSGTLKSEPDWSKIVDQRFLPSDLQTPTSN